MDARMHMTEDRSRITHNNSTRSSTGHQVSQEKILHMTKDPKCKMYKKRDETVAHIVSACPR